MKAVVAAFNQEKALVGAFSVITNLRMELFEELHVTQHQGWQPPSPHIWPSWTDRFICFFSCGELLDIFCCCCWTIYCSYSSLVVGSIDLPTSACLHPCAEQWGKCNIVFVISVCINSASISILKFLCNIVVWILCLYLPSLWNLGREWLGPLELLWRPRWANCTILRLNTQALP